MKQNKRTPILYKNDVCQYVVEGICSIINFMVYELGLLRKV